MSVFNTVRRALGAFAVALVVAGTALAQAELTPTTRISLAPQAELRPGARILIDTEGLTGELSLTVSGQTVRMTRDSQLETRLLASLPPQLDPGPIDAILKVGGAEPMVQRLGIYSVDGSLKADSPLLRGSASFQKVEVTDSGLDESRTSLVPIRHARVEIWDGLTLASVAKTDDEGRFEAIVPSGRRLTVRVLSRLRFQDVKVLDNTDGNKPYAISADVESLDQDVHLVDTTQFSGAFNILEVIQKANAFVAKADPNLLPPPVTIYWSRKNTNRVGNVRDGLVGTTYFSLATNTAYILGDRNTDSDEFDDAVILHEYAHMLAVRFSRDDSPGGSHSLGDLLDPRVAWSEGWANYFACAVLGTSVYRDSKALGALGVRYDIEDNIPAGDRPGYRSEASVQGLLWDLIDDSADNGDSALFAFSSVWAAFVDLRQARFVYLPSFLELFLDKNRAFADVLRTMVVLRSIDFQPDVRPSVTSPFPSPLAVGETKKGEVDSLSTKRTNLAQSAHFYAFTTPTGGQASINLTIEGLGTANNLNANDLGLYLYDNNGRRIDQSDHQFNGQQEIIPMLRLDAGTYVVEVRSFYRRADTNATVFNSGKYSLRVQVQ